MDPDPVLFGSAALFAFSQGDRLSDGDPSSAGVTACQASYFADSAEENEEVAFKHMWIVGIGHAGREYDLTNDGFDTAKLRALRRRDFPPRDHPAVGPPGRQPNAHAARLADGIAQQVIPYVEANIISPGITPVSPVLFARSIYVNHGRRVLSRARSYRWNEVEGELYLITANAKEVRVPKPEDRLDLVKEYHERSGTLGLQAHGAPAVPDGEF
eukprot:gene13923-16460_t